MLGNVRDKIKMTGDKLKNSIHPPKKAATEPPIIHNLKKEAAEEQDLQSLIVKEIMQDNEISPVEKKSALIIEAKVHSKVVEEINHTINTGDDEDDDDTADNSEILTGLMPGVAAITQTLERNIKTWQGKKNQFSKYEHRVREEESNIQVLMTELNDLCVKLDSLTGNVPCINKSRQQKKRQTCVKICDKSIELLTVFYRQVPRIQKELTFCFDQPLNNIVDLDKITFLVGVTHTIASEKLTYEQFICERAFPAFTTFQDDFNRTYDILERADKLLKKTQDKKHKSGCINFFNNQSKPHSHHSHSRNKDYSHDKKVALKSNNS